MLTTMITGVLASVAAEVVTWLNKKLSNTVLKGKAAFLLALAVAFVAAFIKVSMAPGFVFSWTALGAEFSEVWAVSQIFFTFVVEYLGLDVQPNVAPPVQG